MFLVVRQGLLYLIDLSVSRVTIWNRMKKYDIDLNRTVEKNGL